MKTKPIHKKIPKIVEIVPDKYHDFLFPDTALEFAKSMKQWGQGISLAGINLLLQAHFLRGCKRVM